MRTLFLVFALVACPALAGEKFLGDIVSAAGADTTNDSTATPFKVPRGSKLTVNCGAPANLCTDQSTACTTSGAGKGVPLNANTNFPTAVDGVTSAPVVSSGTAANGGSIVRIVGAAAVTCSVWLRSGNE